MVKRSRRLRRSEAQSKKQLVNSLIAMGLIIFSLLTFGPYVIGFIGGLIDSITQKSTSPTSVTARAPIQTPLLDAPPEATSSSTIKITGRTVSDSLIELYLNNSLYQSKQIDDSEEFEFNNVKLIAGSNTIKARMKKDNKLSEFSQEYSVSYFKDDPELEISNPQDQATFGRGDNNINVSGTTEADNQITINGFRAIVDSQGNFSYLLTLKEGENKITVVATNPARKSTTKELTVFYSPK